MEDCGQKTAFADKYHNVDAMVVMLLAVLDYVPPLAIVDCRQSF